MKSDIYDHLLGFFGWFWTNFRCRIRPSCSTDVVPPSRAHGVRKLLGWRGSQSQSVSRAAAPTYQVTRISSLQARAPLKKKTMCLWRAAASAAAVTAGAPPDERDAAQSTWSAFKSLVKHQMERSPLSVSYSAVTGWELNLLSCHSPHFKRLGQRKVRERVWRSGDPRGNISLSEAARRYNHWSCIPLSSVIFPAFLLPGNYIHSLVVL